MPRASDSMVPYFLEYFQQVLLFSDCINTRVQFEGAGTIYFVHASTICSMYVIIGLAHAIHMLVQNIVYTVQ